MGIKRFKNYIGEGRFPTWSKVIVGGIVMRIRNLERQISSENDNDKKLKLIGKQNVLLSYISGIGVAVNSNDSKLMGKIKSGAMGLGIGNKRK